MISFKTRADVVPSMFILVSVAAVVGFLLFCLVLPVPPTSSIAANTAEQVRYFDANIGKDRSTVKVAHAAIAARTWSGDDNTVGTAVLAMVTATTSSNGVKLDAFRPQRPVDLGGVVELPYAIELSGPYPGVRAEMQAMDKRTSKVVLKSVQVSASEEVTGSVTATLIISAYRTSIASDGSDAATEDDNAEVH